MFSGETCSSFGVIPKIGTLHNVSIMLGFVFSSSPYAPYAVDNNAENLYPHVFAYSTVKYVVDGSEIVWRQSLPAIPRLLSDH